MASMLYQRFLSEGGIDASPLAVAVSTVILGAIAARLMFPKLGLCRTLKLRKGRVPKLPNGFATAPLVALQKASCHIESGEIATIGGLLVFFRGKEENAIRVCGPILSYMRECFDKKSISARQLGDLTGITSARSWVMFRQLCHCETQAALLEKERSTSFDESDPEHVRLLERLWVASGKSPSTFSRHSEQWSDLGFQGLDPTTDLRGGGVLSLRQFVHFAETHGKELCEIMEFNKQVLKAGQNHWYLLAVVSIQFTVQLLLEHKGKIFRPQLEVLYDTIPARSGAGPVVGALRSTARDPKDSSGKENATGGKAPASGEAVDARAWELEESDFEVGFFTLHHQLLLHFKKCWHRDCPHVMEYNNYIPTVFSTFFCEA